MNTSYSILTSDIDTVHIVRSRKIDLFVHDSIRVYITVHSEVY